MAKTIDYTKATSTVARQVFGISITTLNNWRAKGCPHKKTGRKIEYNIPSIMEWKIAQEVERLGPAKPKVDLDDCESEYDLAIRSLRHATENESGIAQVQAAKALLSESRKDEDPTPTNTIIAFADIIGVGESIHAAGDVHVECPECGAEISLQDQGGE
jgi:hypothetical protein